MIRANYPILIQVKRESPDGLTPAATLLEGIPGVQVPDRGQWRPRHPERLRVGRLPAGSGPRVHPVVELHGPAGAAVEVHGPDRLRGHAHRRGSSGWSTSMPARSSAPVRTASLCSSCTAGRRPPCSCSPSATGNYNSMQAQLQRRFADGLSLSVNYTLGEGHERQREQLVHAERPGAAVHEPQLRAHQHRSHAQRRHHQRVAAPVRPGTARG